MLRALRIPVEKLKYSEINSLKDRVTWLARELGYCPSRGEIIKNLLEGFSQSLGVEYYFDELSEMEKEIFNRKINYFKSKNHIYRIKGKKSVSIIKSVIKTESGIIRCNAAIDTKRKILKSVNFTGDFFIYPGRAIFDVESVLKNIVISSDGIEKPESENTAAEKSKSGNITAETPGKENIAAGKPSNIISDFYKNYPQPIRGITAQNLSDSVSKCIEKLEYKKYMIPKKYYNDIFIIETADNKAARINTDKNIEIFLLPYCAKLPQCEYRLCEGCNFCGECSTGELVKLLDEFDIRSTTITSYENLEETLKTLKANGTGFFAGCCCEAFYVKHKQDFENIGLSGILINIGNDTCYDLGKEKDAHHGKFEGFTEIKMLLVRKILNIYNPRRL
jgi:lipoate---protein ligase